MLQFSNNGIYGERDMKSEPGSPASSFNEVSSTTGTICSTKRCNSTKAAGRNPRQVERRNARERRRVHQVNEGFVVLRDRLPQMFDNFSASKAKKLSKVETLRCAARYIQQLRALLESGGQEPQPIVPSDDSCLPKKPRHSTPLCEIEVSGERSRSAAWNSTPRPHARQGFEHTAAALPDSAMMPSFSNLSPASGASCDSGISTTPQVEPLPLFEDKQLTFEYHSRGDGMGSTGFFDSLPVSCALNNNVKFFHDNGFTQKFPESQTLRFEHCSSASNITTEQPFPQVPPQTQHFSNVYSGHYAAQYQSISVPENMEIFNQFY